MNNLQKHIEVILFASEQSVNTAELQTLLSAYLKEEISEEQIMESLESIKAKYESEDSVYELVEISNGYQFLSKKEYHALLNLLIIHREKKKLSTAAMETLAIIAYKQPITKSEVELIRGVNCDYSVQKLLEKDLISISGRSSGPGKPILYETSVSFMDHFGLKSNKDLPQLKDIQNLDNAIHPEDSNTRLAEPISTEDANILEQAQSEESVPNNVENLSTDNDQETVTED